jgi:two-component system sensor histidine kinase KdpD
VRESKSGKKVIVAFINQKHRNISQLPFIENENMCKEEIRGRKYVENIISEKPDIVILDELGMRIGKETFVYHIAEQFIKNNIEVFASANLKRFREVNPLFREITGVGIKTTIPDRFLKGADEIIFIDRKPEEMERDFRQGKIFGEKYMESKMMRKNFQLDTLAAYREISIDYLKKYNNVRIIKRE